MKQNDSLGDRMKRYEACGNIHLPRRLPAIVRVDGRAFHTLTRHMEKPFDLKFCESMVRAALIVAHELQGFVAAYVQSDEASFFLQDYELLDTEAWFGKDLSKIVSISAATMSVEFSAILGRSATFDSRAFVLPPEEVSNYFLWRAKDWSRNSLTMFAQANFTHKQLHGKGREEIHEMLHQIGKNWTTDVAERERNGTFIISSPHPSGGSWLAQHTDILPNYAAISTLLETSEQ